MDKIVTNPEILGGKPIIRGTRLSVGFILELLAAGMSKEEILADYPHITEEDLCAVLEKYELSQLWRRIRKSHYRFAF